VKHAKYKYRRGVDSNHRYRWNARSKTWTPERWSASKHRWVRDESMVVSRGRENPNGFGTTDVLMGLGLVVAVGVVGYFVYQQSQSSSTTQAAANPTSAQLGIPAGLTPAQQAAWLNGQMGPPTS